MEGGGVEDYKKTSSTKKKGKGWGEVKNLNNWISYRQRIRNESCFFYVLDKFLGLFVMVGHW